MSARTKKRGPVVEVYESSDGWRIRLKAANYEKELGGEAYTRRDSAIRAAYRCREHFAEAEIVVR